MANDKGLFKRCTCPEKDTCKHNWYISYFHNGRRKRRSIGPKKGLASTVLGKFKSQIREGKYLDIPREKQLTWNEFTPLYLEKYGNGKASVKTDDIPCIKAAAPYFGNKKLLSISAEDGQAFKIGEGAKDFKKTTINKRIRLLRSMFERAVEWGYLYKNPFQKVKGFELGDEEERERVISIDELDYLMFAADKEMQAIILLALMTLLRKKDICSLNDKLFNFETRQIRTVQSKTKKKIVLPINDTLFSILKNKDIKLPILYNFRKNWESTVKRAVKLKREACEAKGEPFSESFLNDVMFRDLRRTAATYLADHLDVDPYVVSVLLGHNAPKNLFMSAKYMKTSEEKKFSAMLKMDAYCGLTSGRDWTPASKLTHPAIITENKIPHLIVE